MVKRFWILALIFGLLLSSVALAQDKPFVFSGKMQTYKSEKNGFQIDIPVEFQLKNEGATTDWDAPVIDGGAPHIYVNVVVMKGVPSQTLYNINFNQKKNDKNYVDVKPFKIKGGYAFTCREAESGKSSSDIYRWHLFVFGNDRFYTCGFTGMKASFDNNTLPPVYEKVIKSFKLIPVR